MVSSSNLTGATVANLDDDPDDPDADWATATALGNTELRLGFPTPSDASVTGADLQEMRVLLRKDAAAGTDPTYDIELWETGGGAHLATLASGVSLTSEVGTVESVTWDASLLGTVDGSAVELRIIGTASVDRSVEVGAVEWDARVPGTGAELLGSRALLGRWPAEGRGVGRDPIEFAQRYAYAGNNPVAFTDPAGLCWFGTSCGQLAGALWDGGHGGLDVVGLVPFVGIFADAGNAVWYAGEGDWTNAGLSGVSAIPIAGWASGGLKVTDRVADVARAADRVAVLRRFDNATFESAAKLAGHYADHGDEFGSITQADYLARARGLLNAPIGGNIRAHVRTGGDVLKYDVMANEFAVVSRDGMIRTFFRPKDGIEYWQGQLLR